MNLKTSCNALLFILLMTRVTCPDPSVKAQTTTTPNQTNASLSASQQAANPVVLDDPGVKTGAKRGFNTNGVISIIVNIFLIITGLYVGLFGFRVFRLLMIILGFYVAYYGILFLFTELSWYKPENVGHQLALFFASLVFGFILSVTCYIFDKLNFIIFGAAVASMVNLVAAQFFIDFETPEGKIIFAAIFVAGVLIFSLISFLVLDHFIIWGSAFVGAIIAPINAGVLEGSLESFELKKYHGFDPKKLMYFLIFSGVLFVIGVGTQYYLRRRIIKRMQDDTLEEIRGTSFLN